MGNHMRLIKRVFFSQGLKPIQMQDICEQSRGDFWCYTLQRSYWWPDAWLRCNSTANQKVRKGAVAQDSTR